MKIIVYTINLGGYDRLFPSPQALWGADNEYRFLYFTDGEAPEGWERVEISEGQRRESRFYKINSHLLPPHDLSIYLDSCYFFKKPLSGLINKHLDKYADISISAHGRDDCVYNHGVTCLRLNLDYPLPIFKQLGRYAEEGLPANNGLTENSLIIRKNNAIIKELNELWWKEYTVGSQRDQLSLPYALWKTKPRLQIFPFSARENKWLGGWAVHNKPHNVG
jgi:hypothetical protein